ncbi:sporulation protein YqfD [Flavonifractor sp. HCP28S3_F3]|uniref:sporulation protein YqfD n=1 Tax=Flavonifractor sp. HCP28S3_F3 TaxID=3438939 RepID=UPI003F8B3401
MLKWVTNALRGKVCLEVEGAFPERFLNLCAQRGILFWNVEWLESTRLRLTVTRQGAGEAVELGERVMCTVTKAGQTGMLAFLERFRRRYALLIGLALSLTAVCVLSQFVLTIQVAGNETVPTAVILAELRRQGLRPGVFGPGLDEKTIRTKTLLQIPELSWMSINLYGTRAQVLVREATPEPEVVDLSQTGSVVARASGIITKMDALSGEALVDVGDTVLAGETLISGTVHLEAPMYSEVPDLGTIQVRAEGKVHARTWRTLEAEIPLEAQVKTYTGEEETCWSATILGRRIVFFRNSGIHFDQYDKISKVWELTLPGGQEMPLTVQKETCRAYTTAAVEIDADAARSLLEERLLEALEEAVGSGEIVSTDYTAKEEDGVLHVTLQAECTEEIGRFVPDQNTQENEADP